MKKQFLIIMLVALTTLFLQFPVNGQNTPKSGDLIITEFMVNPSAVSDTKGEWIEIFNTSEDDLVLNGIVISDAGSNKHTLSSDEDIIISAGGFFVMARNIDSDENGGLTPDYVYSNFSLGNSEDEIIISLDDKTILDEIAYNSDWPMYAGASLELNSGIDNPESNNTHSQWHPAVDIYGAGDLGTPGKSNSVSSGVYNQDGIEYFESFPNPTKGELFVRFSANSEEMVTINILNVLGQKIPVLKEFLSQPVMIPLDLTGMGNGIYWLEVIVGNKKYVQKIIKQ
ncbi:MAG: lamin tail domain-containing protein [Bacteroidales bacterium]|nr:lamin tail domain-containing protein [Bacteroidales bacterium]